MGKFKESHMMRVAKIQQYANRNKIFLIIAAILVIALICGMFSDDKSIFDTDNVETTTQTQEVDTEAPANESAKWRFYWIDLGILAVGGGFCSVMIIRDHKKARDTI